MRISIAIVALFVLGGTASAQQKIGFVDSEAILRILPEYQTARQQVDRMAAEWQAELDGYAQEIAEMEQEFEARELLYTQEDRDRKLDEIEARRLEMNQYRRRHFGPDGELFRQEQQAMRPIQERVLEAIEVIAEEGNYDFIFDRSGDLMFLYADSSHDVTDLVLDELDIDPARRAGL
ncbi:MAG: OmpH family outer membrane protein [Rubricoccaceae bacterium]|nr:OmpH family outer membrane protein [Rubricoccaceae bacterium]